VRLALQKSKYDFVLHVVDFLLIFIVSDIIMRSHVLVAADYSQIEMRVLAHLCQDATLLRLFNTNIPTSGGVVGQQQQQQGDVEGTALTSVQYDIYRHLAGIIMNKPAADVLPDERTKAKVICLGTYYSCRDICSFVLLFPFLLIFIISYNKL
jgi:hypothetical protein